MCNMVEALIQHHAESCKIPGAEGPSAPSKFQKVSDSQQVWQGQRDTELSERL